MLSYQRAEMVFDATVRFCEKFVDPRSRTVDQMVQAARSGKQNILEGSMASGISKEMEIKLTGVARASLEELLADYRDYLRLKGGEEWPKEHRHARQLAALLRDSEANREKLRKGLENADPLIAANVIIGVIKVTNYLLDRQLAKLEQEFLKEGGLRERMTKARLRERKRQGTEGTESRKSKGTGGTEGT